MQPIDILFNPNGRIGPKEFWRGTIVLVAVQVVLQTALVFGPPIVLFMVSIFSMTLLYPYLCVYGKRLHDAGYTAWMFMLFLLGYIVVSQIVGTMLQPFSPPEVVNHQEALLAAASANDLEAMLAALQGIARLQFVPSLIALFALNAGLGYIVANLRSDPASNAYGPATQGGPHEHD